MATNPKPTESKTKADPFEAQLIADINRRGQSARKPRKRR
jgi:hypothetical protein